MKSFYLKIVAVGFLNTVFLAMAMINFDAEYETTGSILLQTFFLAMISLMMLIFFLPLWIKFKKMNLRAVEFGTPFYGILSWLFLTEIGFGTVASMANVFELPLIFLASIVSSWLETFLNKKQNKIIFYCSMLLPILLAIILRALMPTLPE